MSNNKKNSIYIGLMSISSIINILVCVDILSYDASRIGLIVIILANLIMVSSKKKIIEPVNNKILTLITWCSLIIWGATFVAIFFIKK